MFSTLFQLLDSKLSLYSPSILIFTSIILTLFVKYVKDNLFSIETLINLMKKTPYLGSTISEKRDEYIEKAAASFPTVKNDQKELKLPTKGYSIDELINRMKKIKNQEIQRNESKHVSGQIYVNDEDHENLLNEAYSLFSLSNPLHPETFPSIRKFEAEVIRMTLSMMNGDQSTCGAVTCGGTESIIMAIKTYRDQARTEKPWITHPQIVAPVTAHAAFNKGCNYFGVELISVPVDPITQKVDPETIRKHINRNTIAIVGSAPCYSVGVVDPIPQLAQIAKECNIGLHVDCCLGGFFMPFARKILGDSIIPPFDFSVDGVTSISADTHKYGLAVKGSSVLMFHSKELRKYMYFLCPEWVGGFYASPGMAGSRAGGLIAACWASLVHLGEKGYMENTKKMLDTLQVIRKGIEKMSHVKLLGDAHGMVVCLQSESFNIYHLVDAMGKRGWKLNPVQKPSGAHFCITMRHIGLGEEFLNSLSEAIDDVMKNPKKYKDTAPLYGAAVWIPTNEIGAAIGGVLDSWTDADRATSEEPKKDR